MKDFDNLAYKNMRESLLYFNYMINNSINNQYTPHISRDILIIKKRKENLTNLFINYDR